MEMDPPPLHTDRRRCREYLLALEEERRKIQVFQRELPLCLDLVTKTIEGMRSHMDGCEETLSDRGPVLEEFMPLKPSLSLSSSDSEEHETAAHEATTTTDGVGKKKEDRRLLPPPEAKKAMPDWLQSVQLWSQKPQQQPSSPGKYPVLPHRPVALNATRAWGAFQPFEKAKRAEPPASSSTTAAASSAVVGDSCDMAATNTDTAEKHSDGKETSKHAASDKGKKGGSKDKEAGQSSEAPNRKPRRCWAPELHRRFLQALQQLGGSHVATPKQIRELMKVEGLTNDEVKSHLQKYRLHTRRPTSTTAQSRSAGATPPVPQFVVVGGIWVPPPEYAAVAAAAAVAQPQVHLAGDASGTANKVYAPVAATLPSGLQHTNSQQEQRQSSRCSEGRRSGDASSDSPAVSSSSRTISA
ncbi:hypothetical protein BS78_01G417100 [Paspalum vaginatum]|nr:hypothetical protein BS78_01G417100 [Paspalum vaginatum]